MQTDVIGAIVTLLSGESSVKALADDRIFGGFVPLQLQSRWQDKQADGGKDAGGRVPLSIRVTPTGGRPLGGYVGLQRMRVDVVFYGPTPREADRLRRTVHPVLKNLQRRVVDGVLLHAIEEEGGPVLGRESDTNWPFLLTSWLVLASEQEC